MSELPPDAGPLVANYETVRALQSAVSNAPRDLNILRMSLASAIRDKAWTRWFNPHHGSLVEYPDSRDGFIGFVAAEYPNGLKSDVDTLRRLLADFPAERNLMELILKRGPGGANSPHGCKGAPESEPEGAINRDTITVDSGPERQGGTSVSYAVGKLSRERPDLLAKVSSGELSCNAAMIEAGFRKVPTPLENLKRAWARASPAERENFLNWLNEELS